MQPRVPLASVWTVFIWQGSKIHISCWQKKKILNVAVGNLPSHIISYETCFCDLIFLSHAIFKEHGGCVGVAGPALGVMLTSTPPAFTPAGFVLLLTCLSLAYGLWITCFKGIS